MTDTESAQTERLYALNCNRCGGTVEIGPDARYTTCGFCGTQLRVQRSGSAMFTVEMNELKTRTRHLEADVSALRDDRQLEALDRRWAARLAELSVREGDNGNLRAPSLQNALLALLSAIAPLALILSGAFDGFGNGALALAGVAMLVGTAKAGAELIRYRQFRIERSLYWAERAKLTTAISSPPGG